MDTLRQPKKKKMDTLRQPKKKKIMGKTWPRVNIDSKTEYSRKKTHAVYMVGSVGCGVLRVA